MIPPSRNDVERILIDLASGSLSPAEASDWANQWILVDFPPREERVDDKVVWKALVLLSGADLKTIDRPFLHGKEDFEKWLKEFRDRCINEPIRPKRS